MTWAAGLGAISPWAIARAAPLSAVQLPGATRLSPGNLALTELGAVVRGSYQLHTSSVTHHIMA